MPNDSTLSIIVKLQDQASAGLEALGAKMQSIGSTIGSAASTAGAKMTAMGESMVSAGKSMTSAGTSMTVGLTLPIVAFGKSVVDTSMKFEASMELIRTQAGATQGEVDTMTKSVLALAKSGETGQGPQKLADGLFHIESLGYRGAQAMDILKLAAQGADVGLADMESVTNALGAAMVTGVQGTETASSTMGNLNAIIGVGNMKMNDLVAALGTGILPVAKSAGISLASVGSALANLTDNGMRAEEGATRLRMSIALMTAPSSKAAGYLKELGLTSTEAMSRSSDMDAALRKSGLTITSFAGDLRKPDGIMVALKDLKQHLEAAGVSADASSALISKIFGGGRSDAAIMTTFNNLDRVDTKFKQIVESGGKFSELVGATQQTSLFKYNAAIGQLGAVMIDIGGTVVPIVVAAMQKLSVALNFMIDLWDRTPAGVKTFIVVALGVIAVLGPLLVIVGSIVTALGTLAIIFGTTAAVAATGGLLIGGIIAGLIFAVSNFVQIGDLLMNHWGEVWAGLKIMFAEGGNYLISVAEAFANAWVAGVNVILGALNSIHFSLPSWIPGIGGKSFSINIPLVPTVSLPRFEKGGMVPGSPGEAVPIMAHAGEQVIPANQVGRGGVYVTINNPSVRNDGDITAIKRQVESVFRSLLQNHKIIYS